MHQKKNLTLEFVTHFLLQYLYVFLCIMLAYYSYHSCAITVPLYIQIEHKDIEIHIKYRNKKWVNNSKGAPNKNILHL